MGLDIGGFAEVGGGLGDDGGPVTMTDAAVETDDAPVTVGDGAKADQGTSTVADGNDGGDAGDAGVVVHDAAATGDGEGGVPLDAARADSRDAAATDGADTNPASDAAAQDGADAGASTDGSADGGCCGCLCADPTWSCSHDTCLDEMGHALAVVAESGFFELAGGAYVAESQARVSPKHRIWYAFHPASATPENKPLAVFFNGGPGSATSGYLFSINTAPFTLDPAVVGSQPIVANANSWAQFANLLYIDAPGTGFSYPLSLDDGSKPSVGIDLDRDAASVIRVIVRFLERHPTLQRNPIVLVGESYGGTRATLMLDRLFNYQLLTSTSAVYQDAGLYNDLLRHFTAVFPGKNPATLTPAQIATQFTHQVLIQPAVAGQTQWNLNTPDNSVCVANYDAYQCNEATGWSDQNAKAVAGHLTTIATLRQALGVDPTTIEWLRASARTRAYGRGSGSTVSTPEMTATFGTLGSDDSYFLILNSAVLSAYSSSSRWWLDPNIGTSFLNNTVNVKTFITNARLDMVVWSPAIPPALKTYSSLVSNSVHDTTTRTGITRPGWIQLTYLPSVVPAPSTREIRFPYYAAAGHTVTIRQAAELLADVRQWYASTLAHSAPSDATIEAPLWSPVQSAPSPVLDSQDRPFLGP